MFWILLVSEKEEQERMQELFTNQARARRQQLALARMREREGKQAHKKEIDSGPPSFQVGIAKKGELVAQAVGIALGSVPYIGFIIALPARLGYWMIKIMRVTLDFTTRRYLRVEEEANFREARALKQSAGIKEPLRRLHSDGFLGRIRKLLEEPIDFFGVFKLSSQLSFILRIISIAAVIGIVVMTVATTIVLMDTLGGKFILTSLS